MTKTTHHSLEKTSFMALLERWKMDAQQKKEMDQHSGEGSDQTSAKKKPKKRSSKKQSASVQKSFAMSLSELIDLADSFNLSDQLKTIARQENSAEVSEDSAYQQTFLESRAKIIEAVLLSFQRDDHASIILPRFRPENFDTSEEAFAAYQRFYSMQQSEIDFKILKLKSQLRKSLSESHPALARLMALDTAVGDLIQANTRGTYIFAHRGLKKRFEYYYKLLEAQELENSIEPKWLLSFFNDMQELLLAELELRLQPLYGMIEAAEEVSAA